MGATGFISVAILILLLLPAVVLPWEGLRVPKALHAAIAGGGLAAVMLAEGTAGALRAAGTGLASLAAVAALVTAIRAVTHIRVLTSGHMTLLSAGAVWLGPQGAVLMLCAALAVLIGVAAVSRATRPDFSAIAALAILGVSIQQAVPR